MTARKPMTPAECTEALCHAQIDACFGHHGAGARRDRIKAAMGAFVDAVRAEWMIPCGIPFECGGGCGSPSCEAWRKLEEACRGK